jgi:hypothetical protein
LTEGEARQLRLSGPLRSALIAYGIAAFAFIVPESSTGSRTMLIVGIAVQLIILLVRLLAKRLGDELAPTAIAIAELIADGVTVLLFALATYMGILGSTAAL